MELKHSFDIWITMVNAIRCCIYAFSISELRGNSPLPHQSKSIALINLRDPWIPKLDNGLQAVFIRRSSAQSSSDSSGVITPSARALTSASRSSA